MCCSVKIITAEVRTQRKTTHKYISLPHWLHWKIKQQFVPYTCISKLKNMSEACYLQFLSLPGRSSTIMSCIKRETEKGSRWNCPFGLAFFVARRACRQLEPKPADAVHPVLSWYNKNRVCDRNYSKTYVLCLCVIYHVSGYCSS